MPASCLHSWDLKTDIKPISMMMYKTPRTRGPLNVYFGPANQHSPTHVLRLRTSNSVDGQPLDGGITFGDKPRGSECKSSSSLLGPRSLKHQYVRSGSG